MSDIVKVLLIILDGFGACVEEKGNAILQAKTPYFDKLLQTYPKTVISAASQEVGLPWGEMGNSEVGHLNIGAGRLVMQEFTRISQSIADGSFFKNEVLINTIDSVKNKGKLHLLGLVSNGGVHSYIDHLMALLDLCKKRDVKEVCIHAILDGRDTGEKTATRFLAQVDKKTAEVGFGKIASLCGRYFAMDRDKHWDRIQQAFLLLTQGKGETFDNYQTALENAYKNKQTDEFVTPKVIGAKTTIADGDAVIFFNFRSDRSIQLTKSFVDLNFNSFARHDFQNLKFTTFTDYEDNLPVSIVFSSIALANELKNPLSGFIASQNAKQLKIAETEKYAHVTYFFNSGQKEPFAGEERIIIKSPPVKTYNLKPEMSAGQLTDKALDSLCKNFPLTVINFANPDMVGHSGNLKATIFAIEFVDKQLAKLIESALKNNFTIIVTADHGNAESMINLATGGPDKEHTVNPVPLILISKQHIGQGAAVSKQELFSMPTTGILADVSPTIIELLSWQKPKEMNGVSLISSLS